MSRLEEANELDDIITKLGKVGLSEDIKQTTVLLDIAKSLAIIADKLSEVSE